MRKCPAWMLCVTLVALVVVAGVAQEKGGNYETGPYEVDPRWPQPIDKVWTWGRTPAVQVDTDNRIFVLQSNMMPFAEKLSTPFEETGTRVFGHYLRLFDTVTAKNVKTDNTVMIFDAAGKLLDVWKQYNAQFNLLHSLRISPYDPERHVWIVDSGSQQVFKITNDGKKMVMTIGEFKVPGDDRTHLTRPTDVAFAPNGDFYVSNTNNRIVKFSKDGKFLTQWGKSGKGPGEFNNPHSLSVDADRRRVFIADRENARVQLFDMDGKFLEMWPNIRGPEGFLFSQDGTVWVIDALTNKILQFDAEGKLLSSWGTFGDHPGQFWGVHHMSVDTAGNLYTGESYGGRAQKFTPKKGADRKLIIQPSQKPM